MNTISKTDEKVLDIVATYLNEIKDNAYKALESDLSNYTYDGSFPTFRTDLNGIVEVELEHEGFKISFTVYTEGEWDNLDHQVFSHTMSLHELCEDVLVIYNNGIEHHVSDLLIDELKEIINIEY